MILNVKEIAEARGFKNARQLADAAGLRYKSMYPIWNGTARMVGFDTLEKLCSNLRVQSGRWFEIVPDADAESSSQATSAKGKKQRARSKAIHIKSKGDNQSCLKR